MTACLPVSVHRLCTLSCVTTLSCPVCSPWRWPPWLTLSIWTATAVSPVWQPYWLRMAPPALGSCAERPPQQRRPPRSPCTLDRALHL